MLEDDVAPVTVLPVAPWLTAALLLVLLVALSVPVPHGPPRADRKAVGSVLASRWGAAIAGLLAVGLVLAARLGPADELRNPVPALVVGVGWPLLLVVPGLLGLLPRRRPGGRDEAAAPRDVWPAVGSAALVVGYLCLATPPTDPRTLGIALAVYALLVLAVGIAFGRSAVARSEVLGLLARWVALGRGWVRWLPPRGAAAVLGVVLGGAWAERAQRTTAWAQAAPGRLEQVLLLLAWLVAASLLVAALTRWSRGGAAPVLLPLAVGAVVAGVLRRLIISVQLLGDQLGLGAPGLSPDPLGTAGGQAAALAAASLGGALAAAVLARRSGPGADRLPGVAGVLAATAVTAALVLQP